MRFSKTNILSHPYIFMVATLVLFNVVFFAIDFSKTNQMFYAVICFIDLIFIWHAYPLRKIYITSNSIIEKGLFYKKEIFFHQIKQISIVHLQRSSKFIKINEITKPSLAIFQICILKRQLLDPPVGDPNISNKDYIQFDYRPKAYEFLLKNRE